MVKTVEAIFDGKAFLPTEPITLKPNTRVKVTIETLQSDNDEAASFLQTARSLHLEGPPDWSANLEEYLYGDKASNDNRDLS
ncbi:MAG: antitoxin family protein [Chloroflexi bacterium]|nr:antitoxin family protein [Chloroflexota bacterium]